MPRCRMLSESCLCIKCGLQGTEQCASKAVVEQRSDNSAMLKLPTLEECVKQVRHIWNEEYVTTEVSEAIEAILDFIGRQNQQ